MTLFQMCIYVLAKPHIIELYKNQLDLIPFPVKNALLTVLLKRGTVKNSFILKQLVNSSIHEIDLSECEVSDDIISCLKVCENLLKLDLSLRRRQTRHITTKALISLFTHLKLLKIIAIPNCKEVNDEVIKVICQNCKGLIELHIPNSGITDKSLRIIGESLNNLTVLNILGTQISDVGIQNLVNGTFLPNSLLEINIDNCQNLSPQSSITIAKKCPNIKIFSCGSFSNSEEHDLALNGIILKAKQIFWRL